MRIPNILLAASLLLTACRSDPKQSEPYQQLEEDNAHVRTQVSLRDSSINELFGTINRISGNLRAIRARQGHLTEPGDNTEQGADMEQRIMADIESIDALLAENRTLLDDLRRKAKGSAKAIAELQVTVTELERNMTEKDAEIGNLKEQLSSTNSSLATLIDMYRDKSQLADMQRNELNTAYYAVGTAKELRANGVVSKEGGVAGIGAVEKLNTQNLAKGYFTRIDMVKTLEIPVAASSAKLVTNHPAGSYRFEGGAERLVILDPNAFWSLSKYLVVVVD